MGNQYPEELRIFHGAPTTFVMKRSRLLGYNMQKAPRDPGKSDCDVDQRYWQDGRDFLETQLREIRGPIPIDNTHVLTDSAVPGFHAVFFKGFLFTLREFFCLYLVCWLSRIALATRQKTLSKKIK